MLNPSDFHILWKMTDLEVGRMKSRREQLLSRYQAGEIVKEKYKSGTNSLNLRISNLRSLRSKLNALRNV